MKNREIVHEAQGNLNDAIKLLKSGDKTNEFEKLFVQWVRDAFMVKKKPEYLKVLFLGKRNRRLEQRKAEKLSKLLFRDFQIGLVAELSVGKSGV
jgi:DNA polymerase-3 subunit delta'